MPTDQTADSFAQRAAAQEVPPGFVPLRGLDGFVSTNGPVFVRQVAEGQVRFGCRIMPNMCNPMNVSHGGWIATLADVMLPLTVRLTVPELNDHFMLTVSLSIDYLRGAQLGEWVEGDARILRRTGRMVFLDGLLRVGDELVARASGVFRIGPKGTPLNLFARSAPASSMT